MAQTLIPTLTVTDENDVSVTDENGTAVSASSGFAVGVRFGDARLDLVLSATSFADAFAFGTATLVQEFQILEPDGSVVAANFGTPLLVFDQAIQPGGFVAGVVFGSANLPELWTVQPPGAQTWTIQPPGAQTWTIQVN